MRKLYPLLTWLLLAALLACSQQSTAPDPAGTSSDAAGEIPAEVQAKLDEYVIQDEEALVSLAPTDPSITDQLADYDVYAVTYLWGSFLPGGNSPIVWDGHTTTDAVSMMQLMTTIDFENGEQVIVSDTVPNEIGWRSSTLHDLDGITFLLFVDRSVVYITPPELTYETTPITFSIPIGNLAHHVSFHPADHSSGVAVFARRIRRPPCRHGHLGGTWVFDVHDRSQGAFEGRWFGRNHHPMGLMAGRFWTTVDGDQVMRGEVSGLNSNQVIIELEGEWHRSPHLANAVCPACVNVGYFVGRWHYVDGSGDGKFGGIFGEPNLSTDPAELPFRGRWKQHCDHHAGDTDLAHGDS